MPISLRLPLDTETMIVAFGARHGLSKSAVIVRSIQEFLARHAQPSSLQIYEEAMLESAGAETRSAGGDAAREGAEKRPQKLASREAIRRKHATRSARASQALAKTASSPRRKARKQV